MISAQAEAVTNARDFDGFGTNYPGSPEPIYGNLYLPRKFKIAVTVPGDNSVDVLTNDVGVVVITNEAGELQVTWAWGRASRRVLTVLRVRCRGDAR